MNREETLLLVITMEECGELIRACSKMLRHNVNSKNLLNLREEMADVQACVEILLEEYAAPLGPTFHTERTAMKTLKIAKELSNARN